MTVVFAFEESVDAGWMRAPARRTSRTGRWHQDCTPSLLRFATRCQSGHPAWSDGRGCTVLCRGCRCAHWATEIVSLDDVVGPPDRFAGTARLCQPGFMAAARYALLDAAPAGDRWRRHGDACPTDADPSSARSWDRISDRPGRCPVDDARRSEIGWSRRHLTERSSRRSSGSHPSSWRGWPGSSGHASRACSRVGRWPTLPPSAGTPTRRI